MPRRAALKPIRQRGQLVSGEVRFQSRIAPPDHGGKDRPHGFSQFGEGVADARRRPRKAARPLSEGVEHDQMPLNELQRLTPGVSHKVLSGVPIPGLAR